MGVAVDALVGSMAQAVIVILVLTVVAAIIRIIARRAINRLPVPEVAKRIAYAVVSGPITAAVIGYGFIQAAAVLSPHVPDPLSPYLGPSFVSLLVELLVLGLALRMSVSGIRRLIEPIVPEKAVLRLIIYGVYMLGLIVLLYILLLSPLAPAVEAGVWAWMSFFTGLVTTYIVVYALGLVLGRYIRRAAEKDPRLATTYAYVRRLILVAVALIGVSAATLVSFPAALGVIASLFIAAGFASIVIGLAAQSSLSNVISGFLISLSRPFRLGDAVVFRDEFCFVEDVRLMHTVLRTWDNRRLIVPNALFQSEVVINYSIGDPTMLVPVFVEISYESDLDKAMKIMREVALRHPDCMPIGDLPNVVVMEFADSGIKLRLLSRAKDQPTAFMMARDLLYQIKKEFDANGIEIAYPRRHIILGREAEEALGRVLERLGRGERRRRAGGGR